MSKLRKVAGTPVDPTLPKTPAKIGSRVYDLCFDLGALAEAETHFRSQGINVNLLESLPGYTLAHVRTLFPCALRTFHPDISFEDAQKLITMPVLYVVAAAIGEAWKASLPEPEANPEKPAPASE